MNTTRKIKKSVLAIFSLIQFFILDAQELKLNGIVYDNYDRLEGVNIQVSFEDSILFEQTGKRNGKFSISITANQNHYLLFSKEGYLPKKIWVMTIENKQDETLNFSFDVELEKEKDFRYVETTKLNKPIAKIFYDPYHEMMNWDKAYTANYHKELSMLKNISDIRKSSRQRHF